MISGTIMAHPEREEMVNSLRNETGWPSLYDRANNEWDTGRRSLLNYDPGCKWHVVLQDDALPCVHFKEGIAAVLAHAPEVPVSFYIGKPRPYPREINRAVRRALERNRSWVAMRGPIWGVGIAIPTALIEDLISWCDVQEDRNYDSLLSSFFMHQGLECWYTLPSLVNHRRGPSLLPGHGSPPHREAHTWIGNVSPLEVDWGAGVYRAGDPTQPWLGSNSEDFQCASCDYETSSLAEMVAHAGVEHDLGQVDLLGATPGAIRELSRLREALPVEVRGTLWAVGEEFAKAATTECVAVRKADAHHQITRAPDRFTIGATAHAVDRYLQSRSAWAMDCGDGN